MALPENCFYCVIMQKTDDGEYMKCPLVGFKYSMHDMYTYVAEQKKPHSECPLVDLGKHGDLIDRDVLRAEFPEPNDMTDQHQALVHITGIWAMIDCADTVVEAEDG